MLMPFHLAIPVSDLQKARTFYRDVIGCAEGRSDTHWVDFDFYGHQLVIHFDEHAIDQRAKSSNEVDGHDVPIPHFGIVLKWKDWHDLVGRLTEAGIEFGIDPYIRFKGLPGEQATMFFYDPSGNALEFKSFKDIGQLFAT